MSLRLLFRSPYLPLRVRVDSQPTGLGDMRLRRLSGQSHGSDAEREDWFGELRAELLGRWNVYGNTGTVVGRRTSEVRQVLFRLASRCQQWITNGELP